MAAKKLTVAAVVADWVLGTGAPTRPNAGANCQVALSSDAPNVAAGTFTELSGNNYGRGLAVTFNAGDVNGDADNVAEINFGTATGNWLDAVGVIILDSAGTGVLYSGLLTGQPISVSSGETAKFAAGALVVQER